MRQKSATSLFLLLSLQATPKRVPSKTLAHTTTQAKTQTHTHTHKTRNTHTHKHKARAREVTGLVERQKPFIPWAQCKSRQLGTRANNRASSRISLNNRNIVSQHAMRHKVQFGSSTSKVVSVQYQFSTQVLEVATVCATEQAVFSQLTRPLSRIFCLTTYVLASKTERLRRPDLNQPFLLDLCGERRAISFDIV